MFVCFALLITAFNEGASHDEVEHEFSDDMDMVRTGDQDALEEDYEHVVDLLDSMRNNFIKPLHMLQELSGFPNLLILYSIFCSLAVSSASAERALSKLKTAV